MGWRLLGNALATWISCSGALAKVQLWSENGVKIKREVVTFWLDGILHLFNPSHPSIYPSIPHLSLIFPSIAPIYIHIHLCLYLYIHLSVFLLIYFFTHAPISQSIHLSTL